MFNPRHTPTPCVGDSCSSFTKFSQLIFGKIIKFVSTICQILSLKCTKIRLRLRPHQHPAEELTSLLQTLQLDLKGPTFKGREIREEEGKERGEKGNGREREVRERGKTGGLNRPLPTFSCALTPPVMSVSYSVINAILSLLLSLSIQRPVRGNYNLKSHKYVCITTYQPDTKYNSNPNPISLTKPHNSELSTKNIVT